MNWRYALLLLLLIPFPASAQSTSGSNTYVFPIFADGTANGTTYSSTVKIMPVATPAPAMSCTFSQTGTAAPLFGVISNMLYAPITVNSFQNTTTSIQINFAGSVPPYLGYEVLTTNSATLPSTTRALKTGYAVLSCPQAVHPLLDIALFDPNGNKLGDTSMEPTTLGASYQFLVDTRDGTRLGISIVNDSAVVGNYQVIARNSLGFEVADIFIPINAFTQVSAFVDQILSTNPGSSNSVSILPPNFFGTIEIVGPAGGTTYAVGLQYTGAVFSLVAPTVRSAAIGN